jgi:hypothetical protein
MLREDGEIKREKERHLKIEKKIHKFFSSAECEVGTESKHKPL